MSGVCAVCGAPLPHGRRRYCSEDCAREGERRRARAATQGRERPPLRRERVCMDCGRAYIGHIKSKRCPACQQDANRRHDAECKRRKRAGHVRAIGSTDLCEACGKPYTVESGRQRWCKDCAPEQTRRSSNASSRAWNRETYSDPQRREAKNAGRRSKPTPHVCELCGREFVRLGEAKYCSQACRTEARRAYDRAYRMAKRGRDKDDHA